MLGFALVSSAALGLPQQVVQGTEQSPTAVLSVEVSDGDGFVLAGIIDAAGGMALPIPLVARSELVPRAVPGRDGIEIRLTTTCCWTPSASLDVVRLRAVRHSIDEQVLRTNLGLFVAGAPRLPARARTHSGANVLPAIARIDASVGPDEALYISAPPDIGPKDRLVVVRARRSRPALEQIRRTYLESGIAAVTTAEPWYVEGEPVVEIVPPGTGSEFVLGSEVRPIEQAVYAPIEPLDKGRLEALALRRTSLTDATGADGVRQNLATAGGPEVFLGATPISLVFDAPPRPQPGETYTLVLDAALTSAPDPTRSTHTHCGTGSSIEKGPLQDIAEAVGLDFVHMEGSDLQLDIRPTMGPGLAWGDVDGDGWVDLYLVQGGGREGSDIPRDRLFRNKGDRTFEDMTERSGIDERGAGMGALLFDAEGDGDLDLYVANYGRDRLFQNDGKGRFADVTDAAGVAGDKWHAGVAAADTDGDGDLEVYVTSYVDYAKMLPAEELGSYQREDPLAMLPFAFPGQPNTFYVNESAHGAIRLRDATDELGLADAQGRGMQPIFWDFDRDGDQDLYVANDVSPNQLFRNEGQGKFKNVSFGSGIDDPRGCMGLAVADVDGDLDADVFVTNWQLEANALYVNHLVSSSSRKLRVGTFHDEIVPRGLGPDGIGVTKWGCEFFDWDLDGDEDLFYANGYTSPDYESTGICVAQPCHLFLADGTGKFARYPAATDGEARALDRKLAHRAVGACDYDRDGRVELAVTANNGPFRLLKPRAADVPADRHWLAVRLAGRGANTHAIGAEVTVKAGGKSQRRWLQAGASYLAGNPPELHFGLGSAAKVDELAVRWPDGRETTHPVAEIDRFVSLSEPE